MELTWRQLVPFCYGNPGTRGDWKLIVDGAEQQTFLFDVRKDPGERNDLFRSQRETVSRLRRLLTEWEREIDAEAKSRAR